MIKITFSALMFVLYLFCEGQTVLENIFLQGEVQGENKTLKFRTRIKRVMLAKISALLIKVKWCEDNTWQGAITTGKSENSSRPGTKNFNQIESLHVFEIRAFKF